MDFMKMWFKLKGNLNKKNSWGKNELKSLMEDIEIKTSATKIEIKNNIHFLEDLEKYINENNNGKYKFPAEIRMLISEEVKRIKEGK